ncbi:YigZ family protein [Clostridium sp.]|jgi:uncharacterized YigZ family protein|uniref:YigZ family protein n=1 Tax=Clostridium sp. TaxID=1506 RepID=UPI0039F52C74
MGYFTIKDEAIEEFEERKSIFIGHAKRVHTEEEAKEFINNIKNKHKTATHNVYAYIVGENMGIQRYSDDGEPQGTAGIPVLEVIKKNEVTDIAVVVTRYFGGILLGAGGLVRAYSRGAALAIDKAGIVEKVEGLPLNIKLDYDLLGKVQYVCAQNLWHIENTDYTDKVNLTILTEIDKVEKIKNTITECTSGKADFKEDDKRYYFKLGNRLYE